MHNENEEKTPSEEVCDCFLPDCNECDQHLADLEEDSIMDDVCRNIQEREDRDFQNKLEGGDDDDHDEEDMHGSHPM